MFRTEDEWTRAYEAADAHLALAIDQGHITYINPAMRGGIARDIVRSVILCGGEQWEVKEDILDGEIEIETQVGDGVDG